MELGDLIPKFVWKNKSIKLRGKHRKMRRGLTLLAVTHQEASALQTEVQAGEQNGGGAACPECVWELCCVPDPDKTKAGLCLKGKRRYSAR